MEEFLSWMNQLSSIDRNFLDGSSEDPYSRPWQNYWFEMIPQWLGGRELFQVCRRQETWVLSLDLEDPLEEGVATPCRIVAGKIPLDRDAWQSTAPKAADSRKRLSDWSIAA